MFEFNDFLRELGFSPNEVRLLRHNKDISGVWRRDEPDEFGCAASFQRPRSLAYRNTDIACHFLHETRDGGPAGLFVGITRINDRRPWDGERRPAIVDEKTITWMQNESDGDWEVFDLEWLPDGREYVERMLVRWGPGARSWSQRADRNPKEILDPRLQAREPDFPGFRAFSSRISKIPSFPPSWAGALKGVRGIYLLVADSGEQYVGSATGSEGFIGRWRGYLADGHGGNRLLRKRGHRDYVVSILEIASPDMADGDVLKREEDWKRKLGTRAHGLNAN